MDTYPIGVRTRILVAAAILLTAVYLVLPAGMPGETVRVIAPALGVAAVVLGVVTHQSRRVFAWGLLAGSLGVLIVAQLIWARLHFADSDTFPSAGDAMRLVAAAMLVVSLALLGQEESPGDDSLGSIETAIVGVAVGLGVWLAVVEPYLADRGLAFGDRVWTALVPMLDALALAIAFRAAAQTGFRVPATTVLAAGVGLLLVSDVARSIAELWGSMIAGGLIAALSIAPPLVIGAAAVDPTMTHRKRPADVAPMFGFGRVVWLSVAALTPLTVLLTLNVTGLGTQTTLVISAICAVIVVVLALTRMWRLVATVRALTERRGQDRLAAMVEHSSDVVLLVDADGIISYASPGLTTTLGHRADDWTGRSLVDLVASDDSDAAAAELRKAAALQHGEMVKLEASLVRVDGHRRRMEATIANLLGGDAVDGMVATFRDVTEQRNLERQLSHRAFHDELTGLANRALFLDRMDHALRVTRPKHDPVVVLFVDLDDFKSVNDALGHAVGDQMLRSIAERIRRVAGDGDTPARLGGDEFALLLEDLGGVERALDVAESLLDAMREPVALAGHDLAVLASVGVAVSTPGMTTAGLLRDADIAMYEAKRAGKSQIKIFDPTMRLTATRQLEFRTDLGSAIERGQLRLVFQPMVDLRSHGVTGAEALVRWEHPIRGSIAPSEFIPIAERAGLIVAIGNWVVDESIRAAARWQSFGPQQISVNVSAQQVRLPEFVDVVRRSLETHQLDPACLILEINETVLVEELDAGTDNLAPLRELGVRIAVDDFGIGYCSLSYLQQFAVDIVKIDPKFVDEIDDPAHPMPLARMILQLTSGLDVISVAEGIERPAQLKALRTFGCDIGQGYLLSGPLEAVELDHRFGVGARLTTG